MPSMTPPVLAALTAAASTPHHAPPQPADHGGGHGGGLIVLLVVAAAVMLLAGYRRSLRLHPYTNCGACRGRGKHYGAIFRTAHRPCDSCGGTGRQPRRGSPVA